MRCPRCHAELEAGVRFCPLCGKLVDDGESPMPDADALEPESAPQVEHELVTAFVPEPEPAPLPELGIEPESEPVGAVVPESEVQPEPELVSYLDPAPEDDPALDVDPAPAPEPVSDPAFVFAPAPPTEVELSPASVSELCSVPEPPLTLSSELGGLEPLLAYEQGRSEPQPQGEQVSEVPDVAQPQPYPADMSVRLARRDPWVAGAIVLVIVVIVLGMAAMVERSSLEERRIAADSEAAQRAIRTPVGVPLSLTVADYNEETTTPVPLRVTGMADSGERVDEIRLVRPSDVTLELLPGTYDVTAAGAPVSKEGMLYEGSVDSFHILVGDGTYTINGLSTDTQSIPGLVFVFGRVAPEATTDEQLEAARVWMASAGIENSDEYLDAVIARRQETNDRLVQEQAAREEEERRAAEEAAERMRKESEHSVDGRYSFVIPAGWREFVDTTDTVDASGATVTVVHLKGNVAAELARVVYAAGTTSTASSNGAWRHLTAQQTSSDWAHHVEVLTNNWPVLAMQGNVSQYAAVTQEQLGQLVSLSTNGELSLDYVQTSGAYDANVQTKEPTYSSQVFASVVAY